PGSPRFSRKMKEIQHRALQDAKAIENGGMDGIIIENIGDAPFFPLNVPPETIASMTTIAEKVKQEVTLPMGINVLRNDAHAALAIAKAVGASFIRINVHMGTYVTDQGLISGRAWETLRIRKALDAEDIKLFVDVQVKHAQRLTPMLIGEEAKELVERGLADAIIVTGTSTGVTANLKDLQQVKSVVMDRGPVLCGSGANEENVSSILKIADGVIVGGALKENSNIKNPIDSKRVKSFVSKIRRI
ncbi:MAG: BtpA/SgcQ family protein, partial [Candidatus Hodarchaeota archaeon]